MIEMVLRKNLGSFNVNIAFKAAGSGTTVLFGHSGAGKTSVINMMAGLVRPDSGRIVINGRTIFDSQKKIDLPPEKRRFGYVFQEGRLFPHLTVRANLVYGMKRIPARERVVEMDQVINLLGIGRLMDRRPAALSGGEKQRVAIGRALLTSPNLLLMDEPLASLDAERKSEVLPFISRLSKRLSIPIFYVSHALDEVIHLADTLVFMSGGKETACGPVADMVSRGDFRKLSGRDEVGTILCTQVASHDTTKKLTKLSFSGGHLLIPLADLNVGEEIRAWIRSRDVGLSTAHISHSSFQNVLSGTVTDMRQCTDKGLVDVQVDIGAPLVSTITRHAAETLNVQPGMKVEALIKSLSISIGGKAAEK